MKTVTSIAALRRTLARLRTEGKSVALVPTMGALHDGHAALIRAAAKKADCVVVSIFVNPTQFAPGEDYEKYPRTLAADQKTVAAAGGHVIFAPSPDEMYAPSSVTRIEPGPLGAILEGAVRPTHFAGVALVVTKLFNLVQPDHAFFGEKDYQQLTILRQVVRDLDLPLKIHGVPIVRAADGLALSSRNAYLSPLDRMIAPTLASSLCDAATDLQQGASIAVTLRRAKRRLEEAGFDLDYLELRDAETLLPIRALAKPARLLVAGRLGKTRLIDNWPVKEQAKKKAR